MPLQNNSKTNEEISDFIQGREVVQVTSASHRIPREFPTIYRCGGNSREALVHLLRSIRPLLGKEDHLVLDFELVEPFEVEVLADSLGFLVDRRWVTGTGGALVLGGKEVFAVTRLDIVEEMERAWRLSDSVFDMLNPQGMMQKPISLRHPFLFYLGHLPAFANNHVMNKLLKRETSLNPHFDVIFERGIDPDVDDPSKCHAHSELPPNWPTVQEVLDYRKGVRKAILESVDELLNLPDAPRMAQKGRVYSLVAEHDAMHAETLLYMYNNLQAEFKCPPTKERLNFQFHKCPIAKGGVVVIPKGTALMGANYKELRFGWDNEFPETKQEVEEFKIDQLPVTNGEFLRFVESGEYQNAKYWTEDNFAWKGRIGLNHPHSWHFNEGESRWEVKTIVGTVDMELAIDWPAYVSHAEAQAYAKYSGKRLMTEAEFHRAAYGSMEGEVRKHPWGSEDPKPGVHGNFDFFSMAPTPVGSFPRGQSAFGVFELVGNGWEWTSSTFDGFPGFAANIPGYPGYSADFFDGKHFLMLGGSWATASGLIRRSFRNWFQSNYEYTFSKFRCVA